MKKVIIVHGYGGDPNKNWFPWLKQELEKKEVQVIIPQMPNAESPQLSEWLPFLDSIVGNPDENTILIGHSLGCITILRYLETLREDQKIGKVILVSGFAEPIHYTELNNFFETELDFVRIKKVTGEIILINSDNDEHVPLWQGESMSKKLDAKLIIMNGAGHINEKSGFKELPIVLQECLN